MERRERGRKSNKKNPDRKCRSHSDMTSIHTTRTFYKLEKEKKEKKEKTLENGINFYIQTHNNNNDNNKKWPEVNRGDRDWTFESSQSLRAARELERGRGLPGEHAPDFIFLYF